MRDRRTEATRNDLRAAFAASGCVHPTPLSRELYYRARDEGHNMLGYVVEITAPPYMSGHQIQTRFNPE